MGRQGVVPPLLRVEAEHTAALAPIPLGALAQPFGEERAEERLQ